jgi:hypothetical protein
MNWNDFTLDEHETTLTSEQLDEIFTGYDLDADSLDDINSDTPLY